MTWAAISTRQMVLKNSINCLESQLMKISQELQSTYDDSSYDQQITQMDYSATLAQAQSDYFTKMDKLSEKYKNSTDTAGYEKANNDIQKIYLSQKQKLDKALNAKNMINQDKTDAKTKALEAQQEQIETQLEAKRAEYDQLDKACSQDIAKGAPKLVANG